eukprot:3425890-Ditylum_brightwellii.AAC.1
MLQVLAPIALALHGAGAQKLFSGNKQTEKNCMQKDLEHNIFDGSGNYYFRQSYRMKHRNARKDSKKTSLTTEHKDVTEYCFEILCWWFNS